MALFWSPGAAYDTVLAVGVNPIDVRKAFAGLVSGVGVLPGSSSPLVTGLASYNYRVGAAAWVTSRGASDGVHLWGNDGNLDVPTGVAPSSGLSRIDIIYALHTSYNENGDTVSAPVVAVAQGTAASSPIAPTLPTGALELARNTMTSAATSTLSAGNSITQSAALATVGAATAIRRLGRNSAQSIPNDTLTTMLWNELALTGSRNESALSYSGGDVTVSQAGVYDVSASVGFSWGTGTGGYARLTIGVNGTVVAADSVAKDSTLSGTWVVPSCSTGPIYLAAGDVVRVSIQQVTGSSQSTQSSGLYTFFSVGRVR